MGEILAVALIVWALKAAVDRGQQEYGHVRDKHLGQIQKDHPNWSPRRQRRLAKHRARGYWAHQIGAGFPEMRGAFRENRELAKVERAEAEAAGAKRWSEYKKRLDAAHAEREKYVAGKVTDDPATDKAKARKAWFDRRKVAGALRAGATATKLELGANGRRPAANPESEPQRRPTGQPGPAEPQPAEAKRPAPRPSKPSPPEKTATRPVPRYCITCGDPALDKRYWCAACVKVIDLEKRIAGLKRYRDATVGVERDRKDAELLHAEERLAALQRAADTRRAANGRGPKPADTREATSGITPDGEIPQEPQGQSGRQRFPCHDCGLHYGRLYPHDGAAVCEGCLALRRAVQRLREGAATGPDVERLADEQAARRRRAGRGDGVLIDDLPNGEDAYESRDPGEYPRYPDRRDGWSPEQRRAHWQQLPSEVTGTVAGIRRRITEARAGAEGDEVTIPATRDELIAYYRLRGYSEQEATAIANHKTAHAEEAGRPVVWRSKATTFGATPQNPPSTEGGASPNTDINTTGGNPVEAPSYEAAVAAATAEAENLRQRESGVEQFIADLLAGGMGNDQETVGHFAQAQEFLASARAAFQAGVQSMGKHQQGVEYADTGHAAKTEWLATK